MAKAPKPVELQARNNTKKEIADRTEQEAKLKGADDNIKPPSHLSPAAKKVFRYLVEQLKVSGILCNLDIYILASVAASVERIQTAEKALNKNIADANALRIKESYMKDFTKGCMELGLSPSSRARLSVLNLNSKEKEEDPLIAILSG